MYGSCSGTSDLLDTSVTYEKDCYVVYKRLVNVNFALHVIKYSYKNISIAITIDNVLSCLHNICYSTVFTIILFNVTIIEILHVY